MPKMLTVKLEPILDCVKCRYIHNKLLGEPQKNGEQPAGSPRLDYNQVLAERHSWLVACPVTIG